MKLNLKSLRGNPGERHIFSEMLTVTEDDFFEAVQPQSELWAEGVAVFLQGESLVIDLEMHIKLDRECSRCLGPVPYSVHIDERLTLRGVHEEDILAEEYAYLISDEELDLMPIFLSLILAEFDLKPLCKEDCKGLCSHCGADLNTNPCNCRAEHAKDPRFSGLSKLLEN